MIISGNVSRTPAVASPAARPDPVAAANAPPAQPTPQEAAKSVPAELAQAVERANRVLEPHGRQLAFAWDTDHSRIVVTVRDTNNDSVTRQIPSEDALAIAQSIARVQDQFSVLA